MAFRKSALLAATILAAGLPAAAHAQSGAPFTTYFRYDAMHRLTGSIAPDPDGAGPLHYMAVRNTYDGAGRLTKVEKGELSSVPDASVAPAAWGSAFTVLQTIDTGYDALDRKTRESVSAGTTTSTLTQSSYDNAGRLTCTAVRMNSAVFASVTSDACALGTSGSFGPDRIVHNGYDADGRLTAVADGWGTGWQGNEKVLTYTASDKLETLTDGENNKTTFEYDGHDRLSRTGYPVAAKGAGVSALPQNVSNPDDADYEELGYEVATVGGAARATNLVHSRRNRAGEILLFGYDALGRMTLKDRPGTEPAPFRSPSTP
ncbi:MAG: hypothetical protein QOE79_1414 [Sphingomonadales bacterium]|nr:hypothetical protein [Sphingomonadales bacterium]